MEIMEIKKFPVESNGHRFPATEVDVVFYEIGGNVSSRIFDSRDRCIVCDGGLDRKIIGDAVVVSDPCLIPDGIITTITLQVPSGRIIVTDDLRSLYPIDEEGFASYNTALGQAEVVEAYAKEGLAYGPVGNSCPRLYQMMDDHYVIASPGYDEDDEPLIPEERELASICTDLWAYSIADYDSWVTRGGDPENKKWKDSIVEVPPGTYQFVHYTGMKGFDHFAGGTLTFADVRRIS